MLVFIFDTLNNHTMLIKRSDFFVFYNDTRIMQLALSKSSFGAKSIIINWVKKKIINVNPEETAY